MNKVIVITTDNELRTEDYPSGDWKTRHDAITGMIGNGCRMVEHVMPVRLYTGLGAYPEYPQNGRCRPNMLVDEDGYANQQRVNLVGCWLYQTDIHGCPILGNIIIAGETDIGDGDGLDFIGLTDDQYKLLLPQFKKLCEKARENHEIIANC